MPSFDIVNQLNLQEVENALNQARKEIITRYDFKGSKSQILQDKEGITLISDDEFKMKALIDIVQSKMVKRGISMKALDFGKQEPGPGGTVKSLVKLVQGIDQDRAREMAKMIKGLNLKVQAAIQGDQVRVSGKNKDDLQTVIQTIRAKDLPIPLQFVNFRD